MQIDKAQYNKHLKVYFACFLPTTLKKHIMKRQIAPNLKIDQCMEKNKVFACSVLP